MERTPADSTQGQDSYERTIYTMTPAILEVVDDTTRRGIVYKKDDRRASADNVPILTSYAGDGFGMKQPLHVPVDGYMMSFQYPADDFLTRSGYIDDPPKNDTHEFNDGGFISEAWLDDMGVPTRGGVDDFLYFHRSETFIHIEDADGEFWFEHRDGYRLHGDTNGVEIEDGDSRRRARVDENGVHLRVLPEGAGEGSEERVRLDVNEDGVQVDGPYTSFDDAGGERVSIDDAYLDPLVSEPTRTGTPTNPIPDPTTVPNEANPSIASLNGAIDAGFYELRNAVLPRLEEDPDPVPAEWQQRYGLAAGDLPIGFMYYHLTEDTPKVMTSGGPQPLI